MTENQGPIRDRDATTPRWEAFNAFIRERGHDLLFGGVVLGGVVGFAVAAVIR